MTERNLSSAVEALDAYHSSSSDPIEEITDLMTDLLHLVDRVSEGWEPEYPEGYESTGEWVLDRVTRHYVAESVRPDDLEQARRLPKVGDWAHHVDGQLDSREVARVSEDGRKVWLYLLTETPAGPFDASNYTYTEKES